MQFMEIKTMHADFILSGGIVIGVYKKNLEIDKQVAMQIVADRLDFFNNQDYPLLIDGRDIKSINWEAREYFTRPEGKKGITACALLAGTRLTNLIGNLFIKITEKKYDFPVRLFTDKQKAFDWLQQYKVNAVLVEETLLPR